MITKQQRAEIAELLDTAASFVHGITPTAAQLQEDLAEAAAHLRSEPKIQARWVENRTWAGYRIVSFKQGGADFWVATGNGWNSERCNTVAEAKAACIEHAQRLLAQLLGEGE